jgi:hypothetical protein
MAIDFSSELKLAARQITHYLKRNISIPTDLLEKYDLLNTLQNGGGGGGGGSSVTPVTITTGIENATNVESIQTNLQSLVNHDRKIVKPTLTSQSINSTSNSNPLLTFTASNTPSSLYIAQASETTAHWVGLFDTSVVPTTGSNLLISFYNSGSEGFQLLVDEQYFNTFNLNGFTVVRSSSPLIYNPLVSILLQPSLIRVTARNI